MKHEIIQTGDPDSFASIEDGHGFVVLSQCRVCRRGESELDLDQGVCPGVPEKAEKAAAIAENVLHGASGKGPVTTAEAIKKAAPRKKHVKLTCGQVAAVLGVSKSMKRAGVLRSMVRAYHGAESEYVSNVAADYAADYSGNAQAEFTSLYRTEVIKCDPKKQHAIINVHPSLIASGKREGQGLLYLRCPYGQRDAMEPGQFKLIDDVPHHFAQMQIEMHLAGVTWGLFYQWSVLSDLIQIVELDERFIEATFPQLEAFYAEYKEACKDKAHLEPLRKEINNKEVRQLIEEYDELSIAEANAKARKGEILDKLKEACKGQSANICGRSMTLSSSPGSISYSDIVKKHLPGLDLSAYRGDPSEKWTFK